MGVRLLTAGTVRQLCRAPGKRRNHPVDRSQEADPAPRRLSGHFCQNIQGWPGLPDQTEPGTHYQKSHYAEIRKKADQRDHDHGDPAMVQ